METLTYLVWHVLASCGLAYLLVDAELLNPFRFALDRSRFGPFRFIGDMLSCYACTGFWAGVAVYVSTHWQQFAADWTTSVVWAALAGFAGMVAARTWDAFVRLLTRHAERPNGA
jgi:hypothetical protein